MSVDPEVNQTDHEDCGCVTSGSGLLLQQSNLFLVRRIVDDFNHLATRHTGTLEAEGMSLIGARRDEGRNHYYDARKR